MNEKDQIIKYLENAIILEKNVYQLKKLKTEFQNKLKSYQNISYESEKSYKQDSSKSSFIILGILFLLLGIVMVLITNSIAGFILIGGPLGFLFIGIALFNSHNLKIENENIYKINSGIRANNETIKKKQNLQCRLLTQNISEISVKLKESENVLNDYYSKNVIFGKYQNFIAVCTFLEYFKSGRCNTLIGHDGAYNIYENEVRLNLILGKIDQVISRLDNIQENQYTLYNAISESNSKISQLCNSTENMLAHIENINTNTALTAYTSSVTAINSTCQTWLMDSMLKEMKN